MKNNFFKSTTVDTKPCSTGIEQKVSSILANFFSLVFVIIESKNIFVRYQAIQSLFIWAAWSAIFVVSSVFSAIPIIGILFIIIRGLVTLAAFVTVSFLAYNGYLNTKIKLPFIEKYAHEWSQIDEDEDQS